MLFIPKKKKNAKYNGTIFLNSFDCLPINIGLTTAHPMNSPNYRLNRKYTNPFAYVANFSFWNFK